MGHRGPRRCVSCERDHGDRVAVSLVVTEVPVWAQVGCRVDTCVCAYVFRLAIARPVARFEVVLPVRILE